MSITAGSYTFGPDSGRLLIQTTRTGLGAKAGHDLTIEVTRWSGEATIDTAAPANSSLTVEVDAGSLAVRTGTGGVKPLTDSDRADIERIIREKILHTDRYPAITFRSTRVDGTAESFHIEGDLTIVGETRLVTVQGLFADERVRGSAAIVQSRWGIRPYSALLGALKLSDEVEVRFDVALVAKD
ncbi:YceI family protein [Nonomuraea angiospora]|uniref:YceI family protein n=1 Tax=Nonomuraea angiospora TaxID=46172 RepID=UPI0029A552BA|nr:YceI family protein [Nonomuraea angiospora]MDX3101553.1 YceI family protein [Nonomuraea angiospora]